MKQKRNIRKCNKILSYYEKAKDYRISENGYTIQNVIAHEYGHIISDQKIGYINDGLINDNFKKVSSNELYKKCKLIDDTFDEAVKRNDIFNISFYATEQSATKSSFVCSEFFAECFSIYSSDDKNILPKYIIDMIEEVLR